MPYKRYRPIDEKEMLKTRWEGHHSICQQLRDIYNLIGSIKDYSLHHEAHEARFKCRIAMSMAKSMHEKLKKYKKAQNG